MSKLFFDHIVLKEEIISELDIHSMDSEIREELVTLIDDILNNNIFNLILSHLPKDHHEEFMNRFAQNPADENLIIFINEKISVDIESQIKNHSNKIKTDIKSEINKARSKKR